jgi:predicted nucleic-acid-binding protein
MIGLDTNILVRFLVADDKQQADLARRLVRERCTVEEPGFINLPVLCELVWTLDRTYGFDQKDIADAIDSILRSSTLKVESQQNVTAALHRFRREGADFPDALIAEVNRAHGCEVTATFDRKAARLDGFLLVR